MNSLLARLLALCVAVGITAGAVCSWVGLRALTTAWESRQELAARRAGQEVLREVNEVLAQLDFEVADYAKWDELYEHAPLPDPAWAAINLIPGSARGRLCQVMVIIDGGAVSGRYDHLGQRGAAAVPHDPASAAALVGACGGRDGGGLAWFDGHPALWYSHPIIRSDGSGTPRGRLIGLAYLDASVLDRLTPFEWTCRILPPGAPSRESDLVTIRRPVVLAGTDSPIRFELSRDRVDEFEVRARTVHAVSLSSIALTLVACIAGTALIWRWTSPLRRLANACRRYAVDRSTPMPDGGDLAESRDLAQALRMLVDSERKARGRIASDLAGAEAMNAQHRDHARLLAAAAAGPVRVVLEKSRRLADSGGLLPPSEVAELAVAAESLMHHAQDAAEIAAGGPPLDLGRPTDLATFAANVASLLKESAEAAGSTIACTASGRAAFDAALLTPVLVNLLSNALAAAPHSSILLRGGTDGAGLWWEVEDAGRGIPDQLAAIFTAAATRGCVLPGDHGLGLGLALAIANTAQARGRIRLLRNGRTGAVFRIELPDTAAG